jgi:geranylgeranylglycerol-phosphate geranylgeranyltransferase
MTSLIAAIRLIRPVNCLLALIGVWVGAYLAWVHPVYYGPAIASLAAAMVCAAGNIVNDIRDVDIDRISHPDRVMVQGKMRVRSAWILAVALNVIAITFALTVNVTVTLTAVVAIGLLFLYNYYAKRVILLGNLIIAFLAGLTFMTGGFAVDKVLAFYLPGPLVAAVFALLFHLVREIVKDIMDVEGDRACGIPTLPQKVGPQRAALIALGFFLLLVVLTYIPVVEDWFGTVYKVLVVYIIDLPLLCFLIFLWGNPTPSMLRIGSHWLKAGMILGLAALVLG